MEDPRDEFYQSRLRQMDLPGIDRSACSVLLSLLQTYDSVHAVLSSQLENYGLSSSAFNLLSILDKQENQCAPLHEIGRLMVTSRANITGLMDSLAKRGYVERLPFAGDRRIKLARLLPPGKRLLEQVMPQQMQSIHELCERLDEPQRETLVELLRQLRFGALARDSSASV